MDKLLDKMDMKELHIMATVPRQIWIRRNKFIFEGEFVAPWVVIRIAKEQVAAYDEVELRKNVWRSLIMPSGAETWQTAEAVSWKC